MNIKSQNTQQSTVNTEQSTEYRQQNNLKKSGKILITLSTTYYTLCILKIIIETRSFKFMITAKAPTR